MGLENSGIRNGSSVVPMVLVPCLSIPKDISRPGER